MRAQASSLYNNLFLLTLQLVIQVQISAYTYCLFYLIHVLDIQILNSMFYIATLNTLNSLLSAFRVCIAVLFNPRSHFGQRGIVLHHPSVYPNPVQASTHKLCMTTVSYFQGRLIVHGTCALPGYFNHLTFSLENMTFTLNICSDHCSETINGNCFIFSGHIKLLCDLFLILFYVISISLVTV